MNFLQRITSKYSILAKDYVKAEMEALLETLTSDDMYVIFTKTQELTPDKAFLADRAKDLRIECLVGYSKDTIQHILEPEMVKKAKYAHVVKLVSKKVLAYTTPVSDKKALELAKKWHSVILRSPADLKRIKNHWNPQARITNENGSINLYQFIKLFLSGSGSDKTIKGILDLGYDTVKMNKDPIFLDNKAFKVETTYRLEIPKEEKLDRTLTADEEQLIKEYAPDLEEDSGHRKTIPLPKMGETIAKMSDDDLAWHLLNSKNATKIGDLDEARDRFGFREICILQLMNKNLTKKERTEIASYLIDKAGVSFIGGPTLKTYLSALAKTGMIDVKLLKETKDDEIQTAVYYGKISDPEELRKIDVKKYGYQLAHNPHTPPDVLEKVLDADRRGVGKEPWEQPEVKWSGSNPKFGTDYTIGFSPALDNPNYPIDKLLEVFNRYKQIYKGKVNTIRHMVSTLWRRADLPKEVGHELVDYEEKYNKAYINSSPPACFDEKECVEFMKTHEDKTGFHTVELANHPRVSPKALFEMLGKEDASQRAKMTAFNNLKERGEISDSEIVKEVKKNLKFDGPDDLLKHFGYQAFAGTKGKMKLKFSEVSSTELKKLQTEMKAATTHDDFKFEVVKAYKIDQQIHKDYPKMAKEIGNIKEGLYHGTSMANAAGILAGGIDTKGESRTGAMFGAGFYLASSASKAAQYASDNFSKTGYGVVFKLNVALGKMASWKYGRPEHDQYYSLKDEEDRKSLQKYAKDEGFEEAHNVPRWHLTHDSIHAKKGLALQHDEFVAKNPNQVSITEMIIVHKEEVKNG